MTYHPKVGAHFCTAQMATNLVDNVRSALEGCVASGDLEGQNWLSKPEMCPVVVQTESSKETEVEAKLVKEVFIF